MTLRTERLDTSVFVPGQKVVHYRLAVAKYANLTGIGAAVHPGRWNRVGQSTIYTSTEVGTTVCERLVHTPKDRIPSNLALMRIVLEVPPNVGPITRKGVQGITPGDGSIAAEAPLMTVHESVDAAERAYQQVGSGQDPFAVALPSVIVPAWNVVLYPRARGFRRYVRLDAVDPFDYDPRLFPEDTPWEADTK